MKLLEVNPDPAVFSRAFIVVRRGRGRLGITLARTLRLETAPDGVAVRWSTEALCAWLCRRNVHRLRDDFQRDRFACSCGQVQLMNDWERQQAHARWRLRQADLAMVRMQTRLRLVLSTPDVHSLWKGTLAP